MEKIVKRLFIAVAILTAAGVSSLSLPTYADYTCTQASCQTLPNSTTNAFTKDSQFSIVVGTMVQLSNVGSVSFTATGTVATKDLGVTVTTNNKSYAIQLHASQPNLLLSGTSTTTTIPASNTVANNTSGWGVQNQTDSNKYRGLTTSAYTYFKSSSAAPSGTTTNLKVGAAVAATQPAGTYSTTITVTAVAPAP